MDRIPIAKLNPELPTLDSKQFRAVVTLIWPYSSSARQFALLLAEPDFRLRRKRGQVRVRFSGSSAKAIATTGVGIGDEVLLGLRGARFVQEGTVSTPGKSIAWELLYSQTLVAQVLRNGKEIASLDLLDVAPTPAPRSPVRRQPIATPASVQQWSSPAFVKRLRLSDGPIFEGGYDPLVDETEEAHARKRRRKSYRDWNVWTYSGRTPSPEIGDVDMAEDLQDPEVSPIRPIQLPETPSSPPKPKSLSEAVELSHTDESLSKEEHVSVYGAEEKPIEGTELATEIGGPKSVIEEFVRDTDYYDLYAGPNEFPPSDIQHAFGGDTESNTEEDDIADAFLHVENSSSTEAESEEPEVKIASTGVASEVVSQEVLSSTEEDSMIEVLEEGSTYDSADVLDQEYAGRERSDTHNGPIALEDGPQLVMPPPTLPSLQTDFPAAPIPGILTPIGKEPSSPTLRPLDSSTLPLPSPFPHDEDTNATSFLDIGGPIQPMAPPASAPMEEQEPLSEASYIEESSFYNSISASNAPAFHPTHESAFTDLRFTFGMDGAGFSRQKRPSESPEPAGFQIRNTETIKEAVEDAAPPQMDRPVNLTADPLEGFNEEVTPQHAAVGVQSAHGFDDLIIPQPSLVPHILESYTAPQASAVDFQRQTTMSRDGMVTKESNEAKVIVLSSESELESDDEEDQLESGRGEEDIEVDIGENIDMKDEHEVLSYMGASSGPQRHDEGGICMHKAVSQENSLTADVDLPRGRADNEGPHVQRRRSQNVATTTEVIALSSPSEGNDDRESAHLPSAVQPGDSIEEKLGGDDIIDGTQRNRHFPLDQELSQGDAEGERPLSTLDERLDKSITAGEAHTRITEANVGPEGMSSHTRDQQATTSQSDPTEPELMVVDKPQLTSDDSEDVMQEEEKTVQKIRETEMEVKDAREHHPDVKVESIEADTSFELNLRDLSRAQNYVEPVAEPAAELLIAVPDEGDKLNEMHVVSVPATGPARNTRSKTKEPTSPAKDDTSAPQRTTRSKQSKPPLAPITRTTRSRSTISPSREPMPTSPYSLRSQSKLLSPTKSITSSTASPKLTSPRNQVTDRESITSAYNHPEDESTQLGPSESVRNSLGPSQELDTPLVERVTKHAVLDSSPLKHRPTNRRNSPRRSQRLKKEVAEASSDLPSAKVTVKDISKAVQSEGQSEGHGETPESASVNQQSLTNNNMLMTPEATQQTSESQATLTTAQQEQSLPMTPQLTQVSSAGLASHQTDVEMEEVSNKPLVKPSSVHKSTPRRNATTVDIASREASPSNHSRDVSDQEDDATLDANIGPPSIGLSTPIAYYTPLKDLRFFLNRSSQFHSSSNPDVLALVTSGSTAPKKADKGPKHWNNTLQITDFSNYPTSTTAQIFRPYQRALPSTDKGDVILLRSFSVKSLNRHPMLISNDESAWCVWRFGKPVWGAKRGAFGELLAREEVKGPAVERGNGEWQEVEKLRAWWVSTVKKELEEKEESQIKTRSKDKSKTKADSAGGSQTVNGDAGL